MQVNIPDNSYLTIPATEWAAAQNKLAAATQTSAQNLQLAADLTLMKREKDTALEQAYVANETVQQLTEKLAAAERQIEELRKPPVPVPPVVTPPTTPAKLIPVFQGGIIQKMFGGVIADPDGRETRHGAVKRQIDAMAAAGVFNVVQVRCEPWEMGKRRIVVDGKPYNIFEYAIFMGFWVIADAMEGFHPATSNNPNLKLKQAAFDNMIVELEKLRAHGDKPGILAVMLDDVHRFHPMQVEVVAQNIRDLSGFPVLGSSEVYDKKNRDPITKKDPVIQTADYVGGEALDQLFLQCYRQNEYPADEMVQGHVKLVPVRGVHFEAWATGENNEGLTSAADMRKMFDALEAAGIYSYIIYAIKDEGTNLPAAAPQWSMAKEIGKDYAKHRN